MQIVTFSFGSLLEGVMELNNLSRADIAKNSEFLLIILMEHLPYSSKTRETLINL